MTNRTIFEGKRTPSISFIDGNIQSIASIKDHLKTKDTTFIISGCDHDRIKQIQSIAKPDVVKIIEQSTEVKSGKIYCIPQDVEYSFNGHKIDIEDNYTFQWEDLKRNNLDEIFLFDEDFKLVEANQIAQLNLKYSLSEIKKLHIYDLLEDYNQKSLLKIIEPLIKGQDKKLTFKGFHTRSDQSTYPVDCILTEVKINDRGFYFYRAIDKSGKQDILETLKTQSEYLRALTSNFPSGSISLFDSQLNLIYTGGEAYKNLDIDPEKLVGMNAKDFLPLEPFEQLLEARKKVVTANSYSYEISLLDRNFLNTLKPVYGKQGKFNYYVLTSVDNTSLKEQQNKVLIEKNNYAAISNALDRSALVSITNQEGIITHVNDAFCVVSQYSLEELIGKHHSIVNSGHHRDEFWKGMWKIISSGQTWRAEVKNKAKDGTYFWVDTVVNPIYDIQGSISGYLAILYLITERKELEFNLLQITNKFVLASQAAGIGVWSLDFDTNEISWDIQIHGISELGFFKGSLEQWLRFIHPDDRNKVLEKLRAKRLNNQEFELELRLVTKSDSIYFINLKASVETADGQNKRAIGLTWDVTRERQIQQNLEEALKDREVMYKELHHRIKNNLQMVNSLLYVRGTYARDEELKEFIKDISTKINSISTIHEKLLQFSPRNQLNIQEYLTTLCNNVVRIYTDTNDHFTLDIDIISELFDVDTALNLGLIVNEILSNTIKYAYPEGGGPVTISLSRKTEVYTLKATDQGIGFSGGDNQGAKSSYGIQLIELFVRQIDGKMKTQHHNGTSYIITFRKP